jgi:uncharacterized linocin/CFP29 family protein
VEGDIVKLDNLHATGPKRNQVFLEYVMKLKKLARGGQVLTEGKKVVVTTEIIDDDEPGIKQEAREQFVEQAKEIGKFHDAAWVKQLLNGMKQAGIHGVNSISEGERPVTQTEIRQLIDALIQLISK